MIVLYESYLSKDMITKYHNKGYRVASVLGDPIINPKESVGFILTTLYKKSIDMIDDLLYHKHCVTLSYNGKTYTLHNYIEWKHTYQNEKDQIKQTTVRHPILQEYLDNRKDYFNRKLIEKKTAEYEQITSNLTEVPDEAELTSFLTTFAPLYQIDIDYKDNIQMMRAYLQIKWYLDNNIPYANDIKCIDYHDEPMFQGMFRDDPESVDNYQITVYNIGNEELFDDIKYKCENDNTNIDRHIQNMLQLDCI